MGIMGHTLKIILVFIWSSVLTGHPVCLVLLHVCKHKRVCTQTCKLLCLPSVMVIYLRFFLVRNEDEFLFLCKVRLFLYGSSTALGLSNAQVGLSLEIMARTQELLSLPSYSSLFARAVRWGTGVVSAHGRHHDKTGIMDAIVRTVAFPLENSSH